MGSLCTTWYRKNSNHLTATGVALAFTNRKGKVWTHGRIHPRGGMRPSLTLKRIIEHRTFIFARCDTMPTESYFASWRALLRSQWGKLVVVQSSQQWSIREASRRYELKGELARGGMGVVYTAFDHLAQREVAYKRLLLSQGSGRATGAALFEREFNPLTKLRHPNIVQVYEYGIDEEGPYYTMELLVGSDLSRAAPLDVKRACAVLREVASALALVHARRLVHRDITPLNVRLDMQGHARLIDFGALSAFGPSHEIVGTPQFTAPECVTARRSTGAWTCSRSARWPTGP